jgi:hypothetical protein
VVANEGFVPADGDGLAGLVIDRGAEVRACLEMMSGAVLVRDRLAGAGWRVEVPDARKVKNVAALACKTDRVDARVRAELCRRELVPALWIPSLEGAPCASGSGADCISSARGPRPRTASLGCSPSGGFGSRSERLRQARGPRAARGARGARGLAPLGSRGARGDRSTRRADRSARSGAWAAGPRRPALPC